MSSWGTILIPPLLALLLYLITTYVLRPLIAHYRERASYSSLPTSLSLPNSIPAPTNVLTGLISRVQGLVGRPRRNSAASGQSLLGDEELEEGLADQGLRRGRRGIDGGAGADGDRRLSRELEGGFMDDSDEEEDGRR